MIEQAGVLGNLHEAPKFGRNRASLGAPGTHIDVVGLTGLDYYANEGTKTLPLRRGCKQSMPFSDAQRLLNEYNVALDPNRRGLGQTGANFAVALANLGETVTFHTPLSIRDKSTSIIRAVLSSYQNLEMDVTEHEGRNPQAIHVLVSSDGEKIACVDKPPAPLHPSFGQPSLIMIAATSGNWETTLNETVGYALQNNISYGMLASESQLKNLAKDPAKRDAYLRALKDTSIWLGNNDEASLILEAFGQTPSSNSQLLAGQLRALGEGIPYVSITHGSSFSTLLTETHFHLLNSTPVKAKNTAGAGDQYAATLLNSLRGISDPSVVRDIERAMITASFSTLDVVLREDTISGQLTARRKEELDLTFNLFDKLLAHGFYKHTAYPLR
ncbi:MAG TPA: carbohydrate kinase family protein [Patescibacteria group bacterium]